MAGAVEKRAEKERRKRKETYRRVRRERIERVFARTEREKKVGGGNRKCWRLERASARADEKILL